MHSFFFFQAEDGIRDYKVTGVQTCALPIYNHDPTGPRHDAGFHDVTDPERLDFIGRALDTRITGEFATRACLDDQTIAALAAGTLAAADRASALSHVAGCARCRETPASVARALFDAGGRVLYESQLRDTTVALPDTVRLAAGQSYLWKVEARTGWGRWVASDLVEFSIARGPPP